MSRNVSIGDIQRALGVLRDWVQEENVGPVWGKPMIREMADLLERLLIDRDGRP